MMEETLKHVEPMDIVTSEMMTLLRKYFEVGQILTADALNAAIDKYNAEIAKGE